MKSVPSETWWVGQALLFAIYSSQITNACSKRVLMMCGEERRLLYISIVDALANVGLSIVLAYQLGVLGVALGTMIPTTLVGWLWVVPLTLRKIQLSFTNYVFHHLRGTLLPMGAFGAILTLLAVFVPTDGTSGFIELAWRGALCMMPFLFLGRRVLKEISKPV